MGEVRHVLPSGGRGSCGTSSKRSGGGGVGGGGVGEPGTGIIYTPCRNQAGPLQETLFQLLIKTPTLRLMV